MNMPVGNSCDIVSINNTDLNLFRSFAVCALSHSLPSVSQLFLSFSLILIGMFWYAYNKSI